MKRVTLPVAAGLFGLCLTQSAAAQAVPWSDDFESYPPNSFLINPLEPGSDWEEWDGGLTTQTKVKTIASGNAVRSGNQSIWIRGSSDTIVQLNGNGPNGLGPYTSGQWSVGGWMYKPTTTTSFTMSIPSWFIMQNTYNHTGPYNWSVQVNFSPLTGNWTADTATTAINGTIITDQWVEMRADVDLDADSVELFYGGVSMFGPYQWNGGVSGFGGGLTEFGAIDLFADGAMNPASRVYWDDMFISQGSSCSSNAVTYCTAGMSASNCQASISSAGVASATSGAGFTVTASSVEGDKDGLFFYGQAGRQANSWGNGTSLQCVITPVKRGGLQTGTGAANTCTGVISQDLNARWCGTCSNPNHQPVVGQKMQIQCWYRDPFNTSNQTTSLSNALEVDVCP